MSDVAHGNVAAAVFRLVPLIGYICVIYMYICVYIFVLMCTHEYIDKCIHIHVHIQTKKEKPKNSTAVGVVGVV